uniref:Uncharacterized protein n=1 Tax=viral metagenome TaxID=1070528 RepID=A0A6M3JN07_9ZZZZ
MIADYRISVRVTVEQDQGTKTPCLGALPQALYDLLLDIEGVVGVGIVDIVRIMNVQKPREKRRKA